VLAAQLESEGIDAKREYFAIPGRRFRWDFALPSYGLLVEVQGAVWRLGAHTSGTGVTRDCEKISMAVALGWSQLSVTTAHVMSGQAIVWIKNAMEARNLWRTHAGAAGVLVPIAVHQATSHVPVNLRCRRVLERSAQRKKRAKTLCSFGMLRCG
jgi:hypothetical protein